MYRGTKAETPGSRFGCDGAGRWGGAQRDGQGRGRPSRAPRHAARRRDGDIAPYRNGTVWQMDRDGTVRQMGRNGARVGEKAATGTGVRVRA